jgi:predicted GIY-YIG superfamily endonuclease
MPITSPAFGRDERHRARFRHIYGVFFKGTDVYVGQTVDLRRREREHRQAWASRFRFVRLDTLYGTYAEAEVAEQAWRCLANRKGHTILALQGDRSVRVDPHRRRTRAVQAFMGTRRWPRHLKDRRRSRAALALAVGAAAATSPWWGPDSLRRLLHQVPGLHPWF